MQVARHFVKGKTVCGSQRKDDRVFGCRRLQFEIELAAKPLAQCEPPRAVDAIAVGGMYDELRAAAFVEEPLEQQFLLSWQDAERRLRAGASPSQKGIDGGMPSASSTRTRPASTRRMRYEVLPSWNTSPARLSTAKSSLTVPTTMS